jgi:integrase/recombinase XerD
MDRHDIDAGELDSGVLNAFLGDHVDGYLPSAGVMPLLDYLRSAGVAAAEPTRRCSPLDEFVGEYRSWLTIERMLSPDTVRGYTRLARRFLADRASAEDQLGVKRLHGADVTGFLLRETTRVSPGSVCCDANQLRQLLRYLTMQGFADPGLADAVPSVGRWREAGVPQLRERPAIERMLESRDRSRRVGVRDFAILMLLARLGLRAVEVSRIEPRRPVLAGRRDRDRREGP